jgi:hypothetical protein
MKGKTTGGTGNRRIDRAKGKVEKAQNKASKLGVDFIGKEFGLAMPIKPSKTTPKVERALSKVDKAKDKLQNVAGKVVSRLEKKAVKKSK